MKSPFLTVFVIFWEVDFITKQDDPLPQLDRRHYNPIGCPAIFTVVVEGLQ